MSIQHVNRKGDTYYLHEGKTKTGKPRWFFSKTASGELASSIPPGYEIYENYQAQVFLRAKVPMLVTTKEIKTVEDGIRMLAKVPHFLVEAKGDEITVFVAAQNTGFLEASLASKYGTADPGKLRAELERFLRYLPMMRFTLTDLKRRRFAASRWCFLGSIDGWFSLGGMGDIATMVNKYVPHLGRESFFEAM